MQHDVYFDRAVQHRDAVAEYLKLWFRKLSPADKQVSTVQQAPMHRINCELLLSTSILMRGPEIDGLSWGILLS